MAIEFSKDLARLRDENARLTAERDDARAQLQCQPGESIAEVVRRTIDGSAMLTSELARVTADRDAAIAAIREIQQWAETCLSIGATNAGLRRLISKCDDAINAPSASKENDRGR